VPGVFLYMPAAVIVDRRDLRQVMLVHRARVRQTAAVTPKGAMQAWGRPSRRPRPPQVQVPGERGPGQTNVTALRGFTGIAKCFL
jgi:hypothetical protein